MNGLLSSLDTNGIEYQHAMIKRIYSEKEAFCYFVQDTFTTRGINLGEASVS